jgi:hypothetical protein
MHIYNISRSLIPTMERKDKRMHPEDVGAGSRGGKKRRHVLTIQKKSGGVEKNRSQHKCISTSLGVWCWTIYHLQYKGAKESNSSVELNKRFSKTYICFLKSFISYHTLLKRLFSDHCAVLELGYLKSRKFLIQTWSGPGHSG